MATSGTVRGNDITISGGGASRCCNFVFLNWQLAGQDYGRNVSAINWQVYVHYNGADAQLDNGYADLAGGRRYSNPGRVKNFEQKYVVRDVGISSGSFEVGHDAQGNYNFGASVGMSFFQSGRSEAGGSFSLPTIPRYANIDGFNIDFTTDEAIRFAWHADRGCDYISWWSSQIDGGAHHDEYVGNSQGWFIKELHDLRSDQLYDIRVAVRNSASGLWTESGTATTRTAKQSSFIAFL